MMEKQIVSKKVNIHDIHECMDIEEIETANPIMLHAGKEKRNLCPEEKEGSGGRARQRTGDNQRNADRAG